MCACRRCVNPKAHEAWSPSTSDAGGGRGDEPPGCTDDGASGGSGSEPENSNDETPVVTEMMTNERVH